MRLDEISRRKLTLALVLVVVVSSSGSSATARRPERRAKYQTFTEQGEIAAPGLAQLTWVEFNLSCPDPPVSQGVTGYLVELPPAYATGTATATVTGTGGVTTDVLTGFSLSIWSRGCDSLVNTQEPPQTVPAGGVFVMVEAPYEGAVSFELAVTAPVPRR